MQEMMDMNLKNELADKLKKEAEHFSGAQDLVEMLLDAEALIRNLHTENTALRAQIGQGVSVGTVISYYSESGHTKWTFQPNKSAWKIPQDPRANERGARSCFDVYTHPAPQQIGQCDMQIRVLFECVENGVTGTTSAPVKRVEWEDDGTLTAVLDYWPPPAPQQKPLTDEQRARLLERLRRQAGWDGDGWDMAVIEAVEHHHNIGAK